MPSNFESMSIKEKTNAFNKFKIDERLLLMIFFNIGKLLFYNIKIQNIRAKMID